MENQHSKGTFSWTTWFILQVRRFIIQTNWLTIEINDLLSKPDDLLSKQGFVIGVDMTHEMIEKVFMLSEDKWWYHKK